MKLAVIAAALIGAAAAPGMAQDNPQQTPDNARAFLSKLVEIGAMKVAFCGTSGCNAHDTVIRGHHDYGDYRITRYSRKEQCVDVVNFDVPGDWGVVAPPYYFNSDNRGDKTGMTLSWRQVSSVSRNGGTLTLPQSNWKVRFAFSDNDLATRAALAMDVIRQSCDPTAGTGF